MIPPRKPPKDKSWNSNNVLIFLVFVIGFFAFQYLITGHIQIDWRWLFVCIIGSSLWSLHIRTKQNRNDEQQEEDE